MALALNFTFGAPCSGGNHVPVTATLTGDVSRTRTVTLTRDVLTGAPTDDEIQATIECLLRLPIVQLTTKTNVNIRNRVEAKTIDLTVTG